MGTRNLTFVQLDGQYRIAQYGQWDGYPSGQGATVLDFLKTWDRPLFESKLRAAKFLTGEDIEQISKEIKEKNLQNSWQNKWPALTRDTGAKILQLVQDSDPGIRLKDETDFAGDSLFCEWAYVLDLDANVLEVYQGFNKKMLGKGDRFYGAKGGANSEYHPVRKIASYPLDNLPSVDKMVEDCDPPEKE